MIGYLFIGNINSYLHYLAHRMYYCYFHCLFLVIPQVILTLNLFLGVFIKLSDNSTTLLHLHCQFYIIEY